MYPQISWLIVSTTFYWLEVTVITKSTQSFREGELDSKSLSGIDKAFIQKSKWGARYGFCIRTMQPATSSLRKV